ncbi:MAG TPA: ATP-binding protein, partial [Cyclobacteriaceae bacterium]
MNSDLTSSSISLPSQTLSPNLRRSVKITNRISAIFAILTISLMLITIAQFGISISTIPTILTAVVYVSVIVLNRFEFFNFSRILLCAYSPIAIFYISYMLKTEPNHTDILYYDGRILLLIFGTLPCLVFHTSEKFKLYGLLTLCFLCLALFDPVHELLGQGYYQKGFTGKSYYYINAVSIVAFIAISAAALTLKTITERAQQQKDQANDELQQKNKELQSAISEIETQNEEMLAQAEELRTNQEQIESANTIIQSQAAKLEAHNEQLETLVREKSQELVKANEELIRHNSELRQFSYTVSHNLRAPVARLLGLTNLLNASKEDFSDEAKQIIAHIHESSQEFDVIIRDLNKIIDIRNELYRIKEKVTLKDELDQVMKLIRNQITSDMKFHTDFEPAPFLYTVRPVLNSIFYNLLTNAVKYRSPQRPLEVHLRSKMKSGFIEIQIQDNGLGINLEAFKNDVFGLYKRFHTHTDGRGLGLYMVKSQIESLGGKIELDSALNVGTTFSVYFKIPESVEGQVCFESDYGTIYYNARTNTAGMVWRQQPTSEEYRTLFKKCYEIVRLYNTPYWLSDLRKQGTIPPEDQKWMSENILVDAIQNGLKRIAGIYNPVQHNEDYRNL